MNWSAASLLLAISLFAGSVVAALLMWFNESRFSEKKLVRRRLMYMSAGGMHGADKFSLYKADALENAGLLTRALYRIPRMSNLDRLLLRSKVSMNASTFVLVSLALAVGGAVGGSFLGLQPPLGPLLGAALGALPYFLLRRAEQKFIRTFEEQLPEALDFIVRAMRSGHAFTSALEMAGEELADPIASELEATVDQIKFGLSTKDALDNLCRRSAVGDLRFFTIAVVMHKEAGGNITEVFTKISNIIRQRLQFRRQVQALTAEGRFSAVVLVFLPFALFAYVYCVNFDYISLLWKDQAGRIMVASGLIAQVVGYSIMRKMAQLDM